MSSNDFGGIIVLFVALVGLIAIIAGSRDTPEKKAKREQEKQSLEEAARRQRMLRAATNSSEDPAVRAQARAFIMHNPTQSELRTLRSAGDVTAIRILKKQEHFISGRSTTASCLSLLRDGSLSKTERLIITYEFMKDYNWEGTMSELMEAERTIVNFPVSEEDKHFCARFLQAIRASIVQKRFEQIRDGK